ncbi:hypothetical protein HNR65_003139 [Desulfosalsimonas propionicica]|uniref:Uncharacterized protein n=1 Tax=Desulfosalsimonas propionicica TaxID=332175 RepID=A0A7W0HLX6_9BACT|nr:hypothetical protein [Desulfosalsimonas propionicica]
MLKLKCSGKEDVGKDNLRDSFPKKILEMGESL